MIYLTEVYKKLYDSFLDNAREWIEAFECSLLQLEKYPEDRDLIDYIFRIVHNIKSTSGTVGLNDIYRFAHGVEDVLFMVRQGKLFPDKLLIDALLASCDLLWVMVESAAIEVPFDFAECEQWMKRMERL